MALGQRSLAWTARLGGAAAIGTGLWAFLAVPARCSSIGPRLCPAFALQSQLVLRGERAVAVVLGIVVLIVVFLRLVLQGRLPDRIGRDAAEWYPEEAAESSKGLIGLQAVVDKHTETIDDLSTYAVHSHAEMQEQLRLVTRRLDRMAADDREDADDA